MKIGSHKTKSKKNQLKHSDSVKPFSRANTSLPIAGLDLGWLVKVGARLSKPPRKKMGDASNQEATENNP